MNDHLSLIAVLGLSYLLLNQSSAEGGFRGEQDGGKKNFRSPLFEITFKYPSNWVKNPDYEERYEGPEGFFQVDNIESFGRPIDQVVQQEINTPIRPYGTNPTVTSLELDGQPARLITPSEDQQKIFDRELALIVQDKKPIAQGQEIYDYTIIWSDRANIQNIIDTFRFI